MNLIRIDDTYINLDEVRMIDRYPGTVAFVFDRPFTVEDSDNCFIEFEYKQKGVAEFLAFLDGNLTVPFQDGGEGK